mmetsp:Transcript_13366/g.27654  ORF Transcript_13366/g.27654 Transcript_13366/m.27654 type:complete len:381 (+) Transcript_13366:58-1200(+)
MSEEEAKETTPAEEPVEEQKEEAEEEPDVGDFDDVEPPPEDEVPAAPEEEVEAPVDEEKPYDEDVPEEAAPEEPVDETPDFSIYKTNVAERLWRAKEAAKEVEVTTSPDLVKRAKEYQEWRKKMDILNRCVDDYSASMKTLSDSRNALFKQFAVLSEGTPLYDHVGKPLTDDQLEEIDSGDVTTLEGIETRTLAIMKVAEENGAGSLISHQQLAMMQDELNQIDYKNHNVKTIAEWESVVTTQLDDDVAEVRELAKKKDHYIEKVDQLRKSINKIEHRGKAVASKKMTDQLARNEKKLADADAAYEVKANEVSVVLHEATARGWVDFYPICKNVMKFEINSLGRQSACYGSFHATLAALKIDYKAATAGSVDAPSSGSAL